MFTDFSKLLGSVYPEKNVNTYISKEGVASVKASMQNYSVVRKKDELKKVGYGLSKLFEYGRSHSTIPKEIREYAGIKEPKPEFKEDRWYWALYRAVRVGAIGVPIFVALLADYPEQIPMAVSKAVELSVLGALIGSPLLAISKKIRIIGQAKKDLVSSLTTIPGYVAYVSIDVYRRGNPLNWGLSHILLAGTALNVGGSICGTIACVPLRGLYEGIRYLYKRIKSK
jgi:hypothetical protein